MFAQILSLEGLTPIERLLKFVCIGCRTLGSDPILEAVP